MLAAEHHPRREPGHLAEVRVHPGQQAHVGRRVHAREGPTLVAVPAVDHSGRLVVLADQPRELGARVARGLRQIALHQRLRGLVQRAVAEPRQRPPHEGVGRRPGPRVGTPQARSPRRRRQPARWSELIRSVVSRSSPDDPRHADLRLTLRWNPTARSGSPRIGQGFPAREQISRAPNCDRHPKNLRFKRPSRSS